MPETREEKIEREADQGKIYAIGSWYVHTCLSQKLQWASEDLIQHFIEHALHSYQQGYPVGQCCSHAKLRIKDLLRSSKLYTFPYNRTTKSRPLGIPLHNIKNVEGTFDWETIDAKLQIKQALKLLTPRQRFCWEEILDGKTQVEIAEELGLCDSRISHILANSLQTIRNFYQQDGG